MEKLSRVFFFLETEESLSIYVLSDKCNLKLLFVPINLQTVRSAAKGGISPGLIKNMDQGALVPVQMGPLVPVCATNRD
jgi:hypothetical protein